MATTSATITAAKKSNKRQSLMWIPKTVEDLIQSIQSYEASMTFKNLDFGTEKAAQYSAECETIADIYCN